MIGQNLLNNNERYYSNFSQSEHTLTKHVTSRQAVSKESSRFDPGPWERRHARPAAREADAGVQPSTGYDEARGKDKGAGLQFAEGPCASVGHLWEDWECSCLSKGLSVLTDPGFYS
jgi:hypothetical protein